LKPVVELINYTARRHDRPYVTVGSVISSALRFESQVVDKEVLFRAKFLSRCGTKRIFGEGEVGTVVLRKVGLYTS
jgi:hypothetical protein